MRFESFELDPETGELWKDGSKLHLQEKPFQLLAALVEQPQVIVTREELRARLWPDHTFVDFDHSINVAVSKLREALGDSAETPRFVETVPRRGYRFIASVDNGQSQGPLTAKSPARRWAALLGLLAFSGLLLIVGSGRLRNPLAGPSHRPPITSLAVLPLENLSNSAEHEYMADGVTSAMIAQLGEIGALRVISWQSVVRFKGSKASLPEIAYLLDVDAVVVGNLQRSGDRILVNVQLVAADPERQLWANSYDGTLAELLVMQRDIARSVAREIHVVVTPEEGARIANGRAMLPEAYDAYLKGLYDWNQFSKEGFTRAIEHFEEATRIDPGYAAAQAGLADSWSMLTWYGHVAPRDGFPRAEAAARRALELDSGLAAAHNSLAVVLDSYHWQPSAAARHYRRGIGLNPSFALAHNWYSWSLANQGRHDEALAEIWRAHRLAPLSLACNSVIGLRLYDARRYPEAIQQLRHTLEMNPRFFPAILFLAMAYQQVGSHDKAVDLLRGAGEFLDDYPVHEAALASALASAGRRQEAEATLGRLLESAEKEYVSAFRIATVYLALERNDQAIEWLERALEERSPWMSRLRIEPIFDPIRSDDRFTEMLRSLG